MGGPAEPRRLAIRNPANTYRASLWPGQMPVRGTAAADARLDMRDAGLGHENSCAGWLAAYGAPARVTRPLQEQHQWAGPSRAEPQSGKRAHNLCCRRLKSGQNGSLLRPGRRDGPQPENVRPGILIGRFIRPRAVISVAANNQSATAGLRPYSPPGPLVTGAVGRARVVSPATPPTGASRRGRAAS